MCFTAPMMSSEGIGSPRSRRRHFMNSEMSRPPRGSVFTAAPNTYPSAFSSRLPCTYHRDDRRHALPSVHHHARHAGVHLPFIARADTTAPPSRLESSFAYRHSTACVAMYMPGTLNVSNITSAVYSRFSYLSQRHRSPTGVLLNGSVIRK